MITRGYGIVQGVAVGSVIQSWPVAPTLTHGWSLGYNPETETLWISETSLGGGPSDDYYEFERDGTPTGRMFSPPWTLTAGFALNHDCAFDPNTGMFWTSEGFLRPTTFYEWNPVTAHATGRTIVVDFDGIGADGDGYSIGLAYDPINEVFYISSWGTLFAGGAKGFICRVDRGGNILDHWAETVGTPSGLAYNPITERLWSVDNGADVTEAIHEWDIAGGMIEVQSFLTPWAGDTKGAALDMSCDGHLWAMAQTQSVYEIESGDPWACAGTGRIVQYPVLVDEIDVDLDPDITAEVDSSDYEVEIDDLGTGAEVDD